MAIAGVPSSRISDALIQLRTLEQLRSDQSALYKAERAISTGQRYEVPSEEPAAALRAISLQQLLERKQQVRSNVATSQSFLAASDSAVSSVSGIVADIRGAALGVADSVSSPQAKLAAAQQVTQAIQQLVDTGNQQFRGRYLFSGSQTQLKPFEFVGQSIKYLGNENQLRSYSDLDLLFATNVTGDQIFGAISEPVRGTTDLNPVTTENTRLADLRGGQGIRPGSIAVSGGTSTSIIDISKAETLGDIARLLETNPPSGSKVTAYVTSAGLNVKLDVGNLTLREVAGGTTAAELGLKQEVGIGTSTRVGDDLDPILRTTTPLANILGTRAGVRVESSDAGGTFKLEANRNGAELNGFTVTVQGGGTAGLETMLYDPAAKTITVTVEENVSTAKDVIDAINGSAAAVDFTAQAVPGQDGNGIVLLGNSTTAEGGGVNFDRASGIRIQNGGETHVVRFTSAQSVQDVVNILNGSDAGVVAQINQARNGIDIRTRLSGSDFSIGENGGSTAAELGIRSLTAQTRLEDMNYGRGVHTAEGVDFTVRRKDGLELDIDLTAGAAAVASLNGAGAPRCADISRS